jgi:hypothetical protein
LLPTQNHEVKCQFYETFRHIPFKFLILISVTNKCDEEGYK